MDIQKTLSDFGYKVEINSEDPAEVVEYLIGADAKQEKIVQDAARAYTKGSGPKLGKHEGVNVFLAVYCDLSRQEIEDQPYGLPNNGPGIYFTELVRMDAMNHYVLEQLERMKELIPKSSSLRFFAGLSEQKMLAEGVLRDIPLDFDAIDPVDLREMFTQFFLPDIYGIERLFDWDVRYAGKDFKPLFHYFPEEIALAASLYQRYTGTNYADAQAWAIMVNYHDLADELRELGEEAIKGGKHGFLEEIVEPQASSRRPPQFPAWHLKDKNGNGISVYNPGVGSANMLTITELIARKRPRLGLMAGLCGGLRRGQRKGRIILVEQYYLMTKIFDHVLEHSGNGFAVPSFVANVALSNNFMKLAPKGKSRRETVQYGKVATLDQRPWEVLYHQFPATGSHFKPRFAAAKEELLRSKAVGVDMEVGVLGTNFERHGIPACGALTISDVPSRGDFKRPASAKQHADSKQASNHVKGIFAAILELRENPDLVTSRSLYVDSDAPWR